MNILHPRGAIHNEKVVCEYDVTGRRPKKVKHKKGAPRNQLVGYYQTREFNRKIFKFKINKTKTSHRA